MPSVIVSVPAFPTVPNLPGVPQLPRSPTQPFVSPPNTLAMGMPAPSGMLWQASQSAPVWGVFDMSGNKVINADSVLDFNYKKDYSISDYPVQQDAFASFNKVAHPFEIVVRLVKGSSLSDRVTFEAQCESVADSINLFQIYTPEKQYPSVNVLRHEVNRREAHGANFIEADLFFRQINQVQAQYNTVGTTATSTINAAVPSAVPPVSLGVVQSQTPDDLNTNLFQALVFRLQGNPTD
jgi:hypothetical protein